MTVFDLMGRFSELLERPFAIRWTLHTPQFMLGALLMYGFSVVLYCSTRENRRPGVEHGSAKWGSPKLLDPQVPGQGTPSRIPSSHRMSAWASMERYTAATSCKSSSAAPARARQGFSASPISCRRIAVFWSRTRKGETMRAVAPLLIEKGYVIKVFDLIDTDRSDAFNPFPISEGRQGRHETGEQSD